MAKTARRHPRKRSRSGRKKSKVLRRRKILTRKAQRGGFSCATVLADRERNTDLNERYYKEGMSFPEKVKYQLCKKIFSRTAFRNASLARGKKRKMQKENTAREIDSSKKLAKELTRERDYLQSDLAAEKTIRNREKADLQETRSKLQDDIDHARSETRTALARVATERDASRQTNQRVQEDVAHYKLKLAREENKSLDTAERQKNVNMFIRTNPWARATENEKTNVNRFLMTGRPPKTSDGYWQGM